MKKEPFPWKWALVACFSLVIILLTVHGALAAPTVKYSRIIPGELPVVYLIANATDTGNITYYYRLFKDGSVVATGMTNGEVLPDVEQNFTQILSNGVYVVEFTADDGGPPSVALNSSEFVSVVPSQSSISLSPLLLLFVLWLVLLVAGFVLLFRFPALSVFAGLFGVFFGLIFLFPVSTFGGLFVVLLGLGQGFVGVFYGVRRR